MMVFKCKMCGGDIPAQEGTAFGTCDSCGTTSTLPKASDERVVNLFNRANHFRRLGEFDKALAAYESILNEDATNAEAHWNVVLCRYGIEYVEDPQTHERVPTCHRVQLESILTDADYLAALENAPDSYTKGLYETEAKKISEIQKGILAISSKEEPFDIFICYKESTEDGSRTKDSTLAQDIYYQLTDEGFRVFFARLTLEDKLGQQYEPYIFSALNSAKVMLAIGTKPEYFTAVWVKNEWSRFLALVKKNRNRLLIPCYLEMDAYDIPDELSNLQAQDMSKLGFMQDLIRGVKKVLGANEQPTAVDTQQSATPSAMVAPGVESLMKKGWLHLEFNEWDQADACFEDVLKIDPEHAAAHIGTLCVNTNAQNEEKLKHHKQPLSNYNAFHKAIQFSDKVTRARLEAYNNEIIDCLTIAHYNILNQAKMNASTEETYLDLAKKYQEMNGYKDTANLAAECLAQYRFLKEQRETQERINRERYEAEERARVRKEEASKRGKIIRACISIPLQIAMFIAFIPLSGYIASEDSFMSIVYFGGAAIGVGLICLVSSKGTSYQPLGGFLIVLMVIVQMIASISFYWAGGFWGVIVAGIMLVLLAIPAGIACALSQIGAK